jgi:insertion element IS1 protein InsB
VLQKIFPKKNLTQFKKNTSAIERNNCRQKQLAAFRRRSIVVTKSIENLRKTMDLFARFRINGSIDELLALLK